MHGFMDLKWFLFHAVFYCTIFYHKFNGLEGGTNKHNVVIVSFNNAFISYIIYCQYEYKTKLTSCWCEFEHSIQDIKYGFEHATVRQHNKFGSYCQVCSIILKDANLMKNVSEYAFWTFNCNSCFERIINLI